MNVAISARHCEIPDSLRLETTKRVERLTRYNPRLGDAEVTYELERADHEIEIRLSVPGAEPVIAKATGPDFRAALDRGLDRASRQLRRVREMRTGRPPMPTGRPPMPTT
jgi:ribosomal subunit interface protein